MRDQDEIYEAATETPASLGCPSLAPGEVAVHDDQGAETLADVAPDYEMLARELTRDGFDADRLAKAIEAEASKRPIDYPTFYTPGWLAEIAKKMQSEQQREEARQKRKIVWKCYPTKVDLCVMGKTQQNGKVYEVRIIKRQVAKISDTYAQCKVNGKNVLTCNFIGSAWMLKRILTEGMQALVNYKAKRNRDKRRNYAKREAAKQQAHDNNGAADKKAKKGGAK